MDVDPSPAGEAENTVEFHALAIVHMSDQYTRISCGGSPLNKDDPVVGLLFGTRSNGAVEIIDADDIPTEVSDATKQQIALHQAVFPQHAVVGWYRVSVDNQPTAHDVQLTRNLKEHFAPDGRFLFSLLQVKSDSEALPLSLYELNTSKLNVLIGTENWQLETSEPERIGVERVVREQTRTKQKDESYSAFCTQVTSIQTSLQAMNQRLDVLITYLEKTNKGEIPLNHALLRQVQGLVCQLGPITAKPLVQENPALLSHMAVVAKTVQAVQSYTEKCRALYENRGSVGHREQRRY
jgi:COP9 signalosome complex subunit 6